MALLFAGSSTTTIGNPAGEVLTQVGAALGRTVSFVGTTQASVLGAFARNGPLPKDDIERAIAAKRRSERDFMSRPGVLGMGVSRAAGNPHEVTIVVYFDRTAGRAPDLPERVDNVKVQVAFTDPFVAH